MNRVIKFRVWNDGMKKYEPKENLVIGLNGQIIFVNGYTMLIDYKGKELTVEQFTGLTDKNGVEIYEGDLLAPYGAIVFWNEKFGAFSAHHENDNDSWLLFTDDLKALEVIGNVHEGVK